jgi:hypothetical protein
MIDLGRVSDETKGIDFPEVVESPLVPQYAE